MQKVTITRHKTLGYVEVQFAFDEEAVGGREAIVRGIQNPGSYTVKQKDYKSQEIEVDCWDEVYENGVVAHLKRGLLLLAVDPNDGTIENLHLMNVRRISCPSKKDRILVEWFNGAHIDVNRKTYATDICVVNETLWND
jgi:hypothetical protein